MTESVLVTGATGKTGSALVRKLRERGIGIRAATRRPRTAGAIRFDWHDASTFEPALDQADGVYLVAPTDTVQPLARMQPFLERAAAARRRFVLLSSSSLPEGGQMMGEVHAWLARHTDDYAVLRPSWFMQNFVTQHLQGIRQDGAIYSATAEGRVAFIDVEDIASVAAAMFARSELLNGAQPVLTGPIAMSYDDVAQAITKTSGRPVRHIRLTVAELARRYQGYGLPPSYAETLAALDGAIARGAEDRVTHEFEHWTGRRPNGFDTFLRAHETTFR